MVVDAVAIGGRSVGIGRPAFIIAEAGVNHDGSLDRALQLIDVAAGARADAVKFQSFRADRLASPRAAKAPYQTLRTSAGETQLDMLRRLELTPDAHRAVRDACDRGGITFLSTPFDEGGVDLLEALGVPAFKVGSGELTHVRFLSHVASKGRPIVLSTGMARLADIERAIRTIEGEGNTEIVLLHCVTEYPASPSVMNLRAMETLRLAFGYPVGLSDHTQGHDIAIAAAALGACVIEKHFTLDRGLPGPDHAASLEPSELAALVRGVRHVEAALGTGHKTVTERERENARVARRSLVAAGDLAEGTRLTAAMLTAKRPGDGLSPAALESVLGRTLKRCLAADQQLRYDDLV